MKNHFSKTKLSLIVALGIVLTSGCTSSTKQTLNSNQSNQASISPTIETAPAMGLKRKVAIARFTDETKNSNSIFVDKSFDNIGKQAADILSARLTNSGQFIMLERDDLDKVRNEQALEGVTSAVVGADYLIIGSISEFGRKTTSETGIFSRNKIQQAMATVNVRLIDTTTGQIVFSEEGSGEARAEANTTFGVGERAAFDSTLNDKAISAAISKVVSDLMENLLDMPWKAYLIAKQDDQYIMTGGASQGISVGDEFTILQKGKKIKNPQTGFMIELAGKPIATATVVLLSGAAKNEISIVSLDTQLPAQTDLAQLVVMEKE
ncbi:CsgG/HfaB family protein [Brumicola pallidula]|uniref:Curli production assembly/transport component CsgG n=1 Tax=Brumicola pallidula DSM 14239 = ACAM 615 TaxID=1121922 RepID=K6ZLG1_9ALTE|nr:CsgG/HfaB family protein [Glaciecola pallidula]GAC29723.1 curli production assembly/transport component CsgG [Glaciecola pallidula DSM 14239 = ACAM 615]